MELLNEDTTVNQYVCYGGKDGGTGYDAKDPTCAGGLVNSSGRKEPGCIHAASCWAVTAQNYVKKYIAPAALVRRDNATRASAQGGGAPYAAFGGSSPPAMQTQQAPQQAPAQVAPAPVRGKSAPVMEGTSYGPVHFQPVTTESAGYLKETEDRRKGKKIRAAFAEGARGGLKGALTQLAAFVNEVPWFDD